MADLTALKTLTGDPPEAPQIRQGGGGGPRGPAARQSQQAHSHIKNGSASEIKAGPISEIKKPRKRPGRDDLVVEGEGMEIDLSTRRIRLIGRVEARMKQP